MKARYPWAFHGPSTAQALQQGRWNGGVWGRPGPAEKVQLMNALPWQPGDLARVVALKHVMEGLEKPVCPSWNPNSDLD